MRPRDFGFRSGALTAPHLEFPLRDFLGELLVG
jgi:hypothetical protein